MNSILQKSVALLAVAAITGCGLLPRSGPTIAEITATPTDGSAAVEIVTITDRVARVTQRDETLRFSSAFTTASVSNIELIRPLDILQITIWESGEFPLYGASGGAAVLNDMRVGQDGAFFMPQVGRLSVAGKTIEGLRLDLTELLSPMTPEPQVEVRLVNAENNTVRIFGSAGAIGQFPITASTRTLSGLLAETSSSGYEPDVSQVSVRRGGTVEKVWLEDVFIDPSADIALRGGDVINIERDPRSFAALGEFGSQTQVEFPGRDISLMEAIARQGGLNPNTADPTGVFVLRNEPPQVYNRVEQGANAAAPVRVAYVMDLTQPAAFFTASQFSVRDGDIVFVSQAPYVQFLKVIGSIAPPINSINSTSQLLGG